MSDEALVKVEGVSKKFCRSLKRSLWYGVQDVGSELIRRVGDQDTLRKNEFWAVNDISFELKRGECLGLIGPNGAGKSTLLKMLNGLIKPDRGRIRMRGRVGALIELGAGFSPILTARENIYVNGSVLGFSKKEIDRKFDDIVEFAELEKFVDTPVQNFSSGMKVRLGFAIAAQMEPDVLIIDEVLAVGDVGFIAKCFGFISQLLPTCAVIFVSHSMPNISRICSRVLAIDGGRAVYDGEDVSKGIETFFSRFRLPGHTTSYSSSKARVKRIEIEGADQDGTLVFKYGDNFKLHVFCFVDSKVQEFSMNLLIFDQNQNGIIFASSHYTGDKLTNRSEHNHVVIDLGKISLQSGIYSIDISITDGNMIDLLAQVKGIAEFQVKSTFTGYAPVQLQGTWKAIPDESSS